MKGIKMKRIILLAVALLLALSMLVSCDLLDQFKNNVDDGITDGEIGGEDAGDNGTEELPDDPNKDDEGNTEENKFLYNSFTPSDKNLFNTYIGIVIPFAPNNEYYIEGYYDESDYENGINYYTVGNTEEDFKAYLALYASWELYETYEDEYGDTWYCYVKDDVVVDLSYYLWEGEYYIDVFVYSDLSQDDSGNGNDNTSGHTYTGFTSSEKSLFNQIIGQVIPFAPNDEYYVEEYTYDYGDEYEHGVNFYTYGNTKAEFNAYKALFSSYTYDGTETDEYGDAWYFYTSSKGFFVDMSYYETDDGYVIDVYAYFLYDGSSDSGNSGNNGSGNTGTPTEPSLPDDENGVFNVDFTKAENVKDVTDQGYYLDGCPTVGSPGVLVIPVEFSDYTALSQGFSISTIVNGFSKGGETDYYSVYDYYYISSYGQLSLDVTVLDYWFRPQYSSSYYANATYNYYGDEVFIGDQLILNEALDYLEELMDLSKFDSDGNGIIDAVVLVNTLEVGEDDFHWAYRYWNIYTDSEDYYYEYDGVSANDYLWMSCAFFHESYDEDGEVYYGDTSVLNTYTAIHEFGHILGADDYYDTAYENEPMGGCDIMDSMMGDHNAYTKFNYGWLTTSRLVVTDTSVTLTLDAFSKNGDTIIIANNFDEKLGAYQEYYIIVYYTADGLNGGDYGYFYNDGIVVYHVNAELYSEDYDGVTYYDIANNNTSPSDSYGTKNNLIEFVKSAEDTFVYLEGYTLPTVIDDNGNILAYSFTVDALNGDTATITFTKG